MIENWNDRTRALLGDSGCRRLEQASVLVAGLGGVGGYAVEMLGRTGIGHLTIVDSDEVALTNLNRQLIATTATIGKKKGDLFAERLLTINPHIEVDVINGFITPDNVQSILASRHYDYVVDAIDTIAPKVALLRACLEHGIKVISSMGAGGRKDPAKVRYSDLWATRDDGLARAVRQRLKKIGMRKPVQVVCSTELPSMNALVRVDTVNKLTSFGTTAIVPSVFGIYLASKVINDLSE